jgi:hypothetical protein
VSGLAEQARREVEELHAFFVALFTGKRRDLARCSEAFAAEFSMVTPDGARHDRAQILAGLAAASVAPGFEIRIRDVRPIWEGEGAVLLRYVEEQYRDGRTTRRLSSALFTAEPGAPCGVVWRYLQETWLGPPDEHQETKHTGGNPR